MRRRIGFWVGLLMTLGLLVSRVAGGQDDDKKNQPAPDRAPAATRDRDRDLLNGGPSLSETGRIGSTSVDTGGFPIDGRRAVMTLPSETAVTPVPGPLGDNDLTASNAPAGHIDPAVLEPEVEARFAGARLCRLEVARHKRIAPEHVQAKSLELRWIILPSGAVAGTQVVATAPVDPDIMSCVKARMAGWRFTQPTGGALAMDRSLTF